MLQKQFGAYTLTYRSETEIKGLLRDLRNGECNFATNKNSPFILDCGAHIGVMMLWFKSCYPSARIICFEPNPETFEILTFNVKNNKLKNVTLINAAVSDYTGETTLYGVMNDPEADTRGNSIMKEWGARGNLTSECKVKCVELTDYISDTVDFLKLDVEGAEYSVLKNIQSKLHLIDQLVLEVHHTEKTDFNVQDIKLLLRKNGFQFTNEHERDLSLSLPEKWSTWVGEHHPRLNILKAKKEKLEVMETQSLELEIFA